MSSRHKYYNRKRIYVDIDETICFYDGVDRLGYKNAIPNTDNIEKINKLYDEGNTITYYTGRGTTSKVDYYDLTKSQLDSWGCKYHGLSVGEKPDYDLLICDKSIRIEELNDFVIKQMAAARDKNPRGREDAVVEPEALVGRNEQ